MADTDFRLNNKIWQNTNVLFMLEVHLIRTYTTERSQFS